MSQKNKRDMLAERRSVPLAGGAAPSTDPDDPRHRRASQAEATTSQRYLPEHFIVRADGVLTLNPKYHNKDEFELDEGVIKLVTSSVTPSTVTSHWDGPWNEDTEFNDREVGFVAGHNTATVNHNWYMTWKLPSGVDTSKDITITFYWTEHSATSGTQQFDLDVYEFRSSTTSVVGASSIASTSVSQSVGTEGAVHSGTITVSGGTLNSDVLSLWMVGQITSAVTGVMMVHVISTYTPTATAHYHTHE